MSIWGVLAPKFISSAIAPAITVELDYVNGDYFWADGKFIEQVSVDNGERTYEMLGSYSEFSFVINIWKEGNDAAVKSKFNTIYSYLGLELDNFYPHRDGDYLRDSSNAAVKFVMTECVPFYLETVNFKDKLKVTFKSLKYTDLTNSLP